VNAAGETTVRVGWHDLDQNRHANNVRYIEWALAAVPVSVWEGRQPSGLSVRFLAEVRLDQVVHSAVEVVENGSELETRHELRTEDGRSVALARTTWRSSDR
jgi:acyl-ACP thioesterase